MYAVPSKSHTKHIAQYAESILVPFPSGIFPVNHKWKNEGERKSLIGYKYNIPSLKYSAKIKNEYFDFLLIDVVRYGKATTENIVFKLSIELQSTINRMTEYNIKKPIVYGVVIEGFKWEIYRMELIAPAVYLFANIRKFFAPRGLDDFYVLSNTIPALLQLNQLVMDEVETTRGSNNSDE